MAAHVQNQAQSRVSPADGVLQRRCDRCRKKEKTWQRSAFGSAPEMVPPIVHEVLRSPGAPLDAKTRKFMEPRLGHKIAHIRIQSDSEMMSFPGGSRPGALMVQGKPHVGSTYDNFEQEADLVAEKIARIPYPLASEAPAKLRNLSLLKYPPNTVCIQKLAGSSMEVNYIQRSCRPCKERENGNAIQAESLSSAISEPSMNVNTAFRAIERGGEPLPKAVLEFFELNLGHDFSRVQVHANAEAANAARAVRARAYTLGSHIVFGSREYAPYAVDGRRLLAHELTHVIQQGSDHNASHLMRKPSQDDEPEADCPEHPPNRAEEIMLSRESPGGIAGETEPLALSLYNFAIDDSTPKPEHVQILSELATLLNSHARAQVRLHLVGHTDCTGSVGYNTRLSERRARAVRDVLTPLLSRRIGISWASEFQPVASNASAEGRSRNRRVDVRFVAVATLPRATEIQPSQRQPEREHQPEHEPERERQPERDRPTSLCLDYPFLCAGPGLPWILPLICLINPALCLIPVIPPILPPPPEPEGPERPRRQPPRVDFVPDVRAPNTPTGMNDRISNMTPVTIIAAVTNPPTAGQSIQIEIDGVGAQAGAATVNGSRSIQITGTTTMQVQGTAMTAAGSSAPRLQLGAWFAGDLVGASNQFSVSAIMQNWQTIFDGAEEFPLGFNMYVKMHWASDGKSIRDLSDCHYVELVGVDREEGAMQGMGIGDVQDPDDFGLGDIMPGGDRHGTERRWLTGPGFQRLHQIWQMRDTRSNSDWIPSRNSGFHIERRYERDARNPLCWQLTVEKSGGAARIGARASAAGSGLARHVWHGINCESPPPSPIPPEREDQPVPTPVPEPHDPERQTPSAPQCDSAELARRVDQCIEEARRSAIECGKGLIPFRRGWGGIRGGIEFWVCLEMMRRTLLECDRRAKEDTHCQD